MRLSSDYRKQTALHPLPGMRHSLGLIAAAMLLAGALGLVSCGKKPPGSEAVPADLPPAVRKQLTQLYSTLPTATAAAQEFGRLGSQAAQAIPFLIQLMGDEALVPGSDRPISRGDIAAGALASIGKPAVPALIEALRDPGEQRRALAAWALAEIGDRRAVEPLIVALEGGDPQFREWVANALAKITGRFGPNKLATEAADGTSAEGWRQWWAESQTKSPATGASAQPDPPSPQP